jgi:enamine deaminase RidA (YjgF/YER057c/UK114 family)
LSVERIDSNARMSKVVVHGDTVYLAGLTADKTVGQGLAEQTREVLSLIDSFLAKAGTDKSKLLTATIWLSDIRTVGEMNKEWDAWVTPGHTPARACIEAPPARPGEENRDTGDRGALTGVARQRDCNSRPRRPIPPPP